MEGLGLDVLMVVLALFLVALNGLFVAAEFGFVKIRATQVEHLVQEGEGDEVRLEGYLLRVEEVDGPRVERVIVQRVHGQSRER